MRYILALTLAAVPVTAQQPTADQLMQIYIVGGSGQGWRQIAIEGTPHECVSKDHGKVVDWAVMRLHQMAKGTAI